MKRYGNPVDRLQRYRRVAFCPANAISFEPRMNGKLFVSSTKYGPLVPAKLGVADGNSGKLVALVRSKAKQIALEEKREIVIIDGPPGIGCLVISAITGADAVMIVTEPSLPGVHDMERVVRLTRHFKISTYITVNKFNINPAITEYIMVRTKELGLIALGKIHYDIIVTEAQVRGLPVVEYGSSAVGDEIRSIRDSFLDQVIGSENSVGSARISKYRDNS